MITPSIDNMKEYLREDDLIDFNNEINVQLADFLSQKADSEIEYINAAYDFFGDNIFHYADINEDIRFWIQRRNDTSR